MAAKTLRMSLTLSPNVAQKKTPLDLVRYARLRASRVGGVAVTKALLPSRQISGCNGYAMRVRIPRTVLRANDLASL
jgi:hypothetical protein